MLKANADDNGWGSRTSKHSLEASGSDEKLWGQLIQARLTGQDVAVGEPKRLNIEAARPSSPCEASNSGARLQSSPPDKAEGLESSESLSTSLCSGRKISASVTPAAHKSSAGASYRAGEKSSSGARYGLL